MTSTQAYAPIGTSVKMTGAEYMAAWDAKSIPEAAVYTAFHETHDWANGERIDLRIPEFLGALTKLGWSIDVVRESPGPEHPVTAAYADADVMWRALEGADEDAFEPGFEGYDEEGDWISNQDIWSARRFVWGCGQRGPTFVRNTPKA